MKVQKFLRGTLLALFAGTVTTTTSNAAELPSPEPRTLEALEKTLASDRKLDLDQIQRRSIGEIDVPTGRLIAIDPISKIGTDDIFVQKIPAGSFPVFIYMMQVGQDDKRVALAELRISDDPVSYWKLAQTVNQVPPKKMGESDYGYQVESAIGAFSSPESLKKILNPAMYKDGDSFYSEFLQPLLAKGEQPSALLFNLPTDKKANLAVFETGDSDGVYPSYFGYNETGKPVKLVTTFFLIEDRKR